MIAKQLELLQRMRAALVGIADLDPKGVATRIIETDWELDRVSALMEADAPRPDGVASSRVVEIVPIGLRLRAA